MQLFHLFLLGNGSCGKSQLIQTIYHTVSKGVLLLAPTGVAAININGNKIHSGLHKQALNDTNKAELRNKYLHVELIIVDEISMISSKLFCQV